MLETYLDMLELDYFELGEAFKELADENLWKRPTESSLSVGEIAGHICYAEATRLGGVKDRAAHAVTETDAYHISSPLIDIRFEYYPEILATSSSEEHLAMTVSDVLQEVMRVHTESVAAFRRRHPDLDSNVDGWHEALTHKENLKYMVFHVAYHTGQVYLTRHLLGETTVDN